ncbi:MAG: LuxR family transcriptional regulator [Alphaproteobacteria bacterium]|nr:LuxR family transcriptional regulator [Alphaproteobacteria bacterium]
MRMIRSFEEYVDKTSYAQSPEELFDAYLLAVKRHGLDRALFALITDHTEINKSAGVGVIHNFPQDWMTHYFEKEFHKVDPVIIYGAEKVEAYTWAEIPLNLELTKKQKLCLNYGNEAGLHSGVATYLHAGRNQTAGVSLASSHKKDSFDGRVDLITAYSNHFYMMYRKMHNVKDHKPTNILLTDKEREVLVWAAAGKSNLDIGCILTMSENTVDFHLRNIFRKLDCNSRIVAIVKAITLGLIRS